MVTGLALTGVGVILRQTDRWWFSPHRGRHVLRGLREVMALQRARLNDVTPVLLLAGHWLEVAGWCLVAAHGGAWGCVAAAGAGAVKFRHLQEVSHFAVHGVLARSRRMNVLLAEAAVHVPLGLVPVAVRRRRHVREHHPNATVAGLDPNLAELRRAGLREGAGAPRCALAMVHPLTPVGVADTMRGLAAHLSAPGAGKWRTAGAVAVPAATAALFGWQAALFVWILPRLLLYPQLAWMSLLVEHRWFDPDPVTGPPAAVEAGRCLRLYPRNRLLALLARGTWLPYGDLYHFAHSVHPAVRWNYLPALEACLEGPAFAPDSLLIGVGSVLRHHCRALTAVGPLTASAAPTRPSLPM